ncbi:MAG: PIN domain-containing protein [Pirellulales bacterium]|nr:PIN domain-containing protein [Pirellulales bacterium]
MTLTDAGPLIALINRNDPNHGTCVTALLGLPSGPLVTTWPCFTEAMYLLFRAGGFPAQRELWRLVADGRLVLHELSSTAAVRSAELMEKYRDRPMDLADATLVALAESISIDDVFTLDRDFQIYRLASGEALRIIP